jgi:hypothetical protein
VRSNARAGTHAALVPCQHAHQMQTCGAPSGLHANCSALHENNAAGSGGGLRTAADSLFDVALPERVLRPLRQL